MRPDGQERRRAARARAEFPIHIQTPSGMVVGALKDISSSGLCCTFPDALREMTLCKLALELPGTPQRVDVEGVVVRTDKLRDRTPPTYEVAFYFTKLEADARAAVDRFVAGHLAVAR
jgi:hypothetical protein